MTKETKVKVKITSPVKVKDGKAVLRKKLNVGEVVEIDREVAQDLISIHAAEPKDKESADILKDVKKRELDLKGILDKSMTAPSTK